MVNKLNVSSYFTMLFESHTAQEQDLSQTLRRLCCLSAVRAFSRTARFKKIIENDKLKGRMFLTTSLSLDRFTFESKKANWQHQPIFSLFNSFLVAR